MQRILDHRAATGGGESLAGRGDHLRIGEIGVDRLRAREVAGGGREGQPGVEGEGESAGMHEFAVAAAQDGPRVAGQVPGEAEPRLPGRQRGHGLVDFVAVARPVVAQAQLQSQAGQRPPGVLHVSPGQAAAVGLTRQLGRDAVEEGTVVVRIEGAAGDVVQRVERQRRVRGAALEFVIAAEAVDERGEAGLRLGAVAGARLHTGVIARADLGVEIDHSRRLEVAALRTVLDFALVEPQLQLPEEAVGKLA